MRVIKGYNKEKFRDYTIKAESLFCYKLRITQALRYIDKHLLFLFYDGRMIQNYLTGGYLKRLGYQESKVRGDMYDKYGRRI